MEETERPVKAILASNIKWDTDGQGRKNGVEYGLPSEAKVPVSELLYDDERPQDVDVEELEDRVVDYLSDKYGFCIFGLSTEEVYE